LESESALTSPAFSPPREKIFSRKGITDSFTKSAQRGILMHRPSTPSRPRSSAISADNITTELESLGRGTLYQETYNDVHTAEPGQLALIAQNLTPGDRNSSARSPLTARIISAVSNVFTSKSEDPNDDNISGGLDSLYTSQQDTTINEVNPVNSWIDKDLPPDVKKGMYLSTSTDDYLAEMNPILQAQNNIKNQLAKKYGLLPRNPESPPNAPVQGYKDHLSSLTRALVDAATSKSSAKKKEKYWMEQVEIISDVPETITEEEIMKRLQVLKEKAQYLESLLLIKAKERS
jgi:hypothetical protein